MDKALIVNVREHLLGNRPSLQGLATPFVALADVNVQ